MIQGKEGVSALVKRLAVYSPMGLRTAPSLTRWEPLYGPLLRAYLRSHDRAQRFTTLTLTLREAAEGSPFPG